MVRAYFSWWYTSGWLDQVSRVKLGFAKLLDLFSISILLRTLFAPFHQVSANDSGRGPVEALKAWGSRTFSRFFGFFVRTFTIIIGLIVLLFNCLISGVRLILWFVLPFVPFIYIILVVARII